MQVLQRDINACACINCFCLEKDVLSCNQGGNPGVIICEVKPGYTFDYNIDGTSFALDIPRVEATHAGNYICQLKTANTSVLTEPCTLRIATGEHYRTDCRGL